MRDFRNAKAMARTLRQALAAKGVTISNGQSLELVAKMLGERDWNTLSAAIQAPPATPARTPPPTGSEGYMRRGNFFSSALEATLHRAVALANDCKHEYATLEHLLLALLDDEDAAAVLSACAADIEAMRADLSGWIETGLRQLVRGGGEFYAGPTAGFHRVVRQAVIHVQSAGRNTVTGANVLVTIFSERESYAFGVLARQNVDRFDAVNFIAHGVRKGGGKAA